jgi:hypothetical protein
LNNKSTTESLENYYYNILKRRESDNTLFFGANFPDSIKFRLFSHYFLHSTMSSALSKTTSSSSSAVARAVPPIDVLVDGGFHRLGKATKLMIAASQGSFRTLEKVLRQGARVDIVNEIGFTAMHFAAKAKSDNSAVIKELHAQGLSVSGKSHTYFSDILPNDGFTPLHVVESAGSAAALIELGADPNKLGVTPIWSGLFYRKQFTCIETAVMLGKSSVLEAMIDCGAVVSVRHCWLAACEGKASTFKLLLERCGHINLAYFEKGRTMAQAAWRKGNENLSSRKGCDEILKMLEAAGAPDQMPGNDDGTGPVYGRPYIREADYGKRDEDSEE